MFLQRTDKSWWFAGQNYSMGVFSNNNVYSVWTKVLVPEEIIQICTFRHHANGVDGDYTTLLMLSKSGRLWGAGVNNYGQLGNGNANNVAGVNYSYLIPAYTALMG